MIFEEVKRIAEAILFASNKPVLLEDIKELLGEVESPLIRDAILELQKEYDVPGRSLRITQVAGGFQMTTAPDCGEWLKKFFRIHHAERLSSPALETLSIVAYKQPITRAEIEGIRGVNTDGVLNTLLERGLIRIAGRKEAVGKPMLYATTKEFLQSFGLNALADLPKLEELADEPSPSEYEIRQSREGVGEPSPS